MGVVIGRCSMSLILCNNILVIECMCSMFIVPIIVERGNVYLFDIMKWVHIQNSIFYFLFVIPILYNEMINIIMYHYDYHYYISLFRVITLGVCLPCLIISNFWCIWNENDVHIYGDYTMVGIVLCQWYIIMYFAFPDFSSNVMVTGSDWMDPIPTCVYSDIA